MFFVNIKKSLQLLEMSAETESFEQEEEEEDTAENDARMGSRQ